MDDEKCGPNSEHFKHRWYSIEAVTRDKENELSIDVCRSCGRVELAYRFDDGVAYGYRSTKRAEIVLFAGEGK